MPYIENTNYSPPSFFKNNFLSTVFPVIFRKIDDVKYSRERVELNDGDFIDLDWHKNGSGHLVFIIHGLGSNSNGINIKAMVRACRLNGLDAVVMNLRGCSGETNRLLKTFHAGISEDVENCIEYLLQKYEYESIFLIGFSLGGNILLKYLGEQGGDICSKIKKAACISVPYDLLSCSFELEKKRNKFFTNWYLKKLKKSIQIKKKVFPDKICDKDFDKIKNFKEYDNRYTAPLNGFKNAYDYWDKTSCKNFISNIKVKTLLINAKDDPILSNDCYPVEIAKENDFLHLETPDFGGHCGFVEFNKNKLYWHENRVINFFIYEN